MFKRMAVMAVMSMMAVFFSGCGDGSSDPTGPDDGPVVAKHRIEFTVVDGKTVQQVFPAIVNGKIVGLKIRGGATEVSVSDVQWTLFFDRNSGEVLHAPFGIPAIITGAPSVGLGTWAFGLADGSTAPMDPNWIEIVGRNYRIEGNNIRYFN